MICVLIICAMLSSEVQDSGLLRLVNRQAPLCQNFYPSNLKEFHGIKVNASAHEAFLLMVEAMAADDIGGIILQSAYRPYKYQQAIFNRRVEELKQEGKDENEAIYLTTRSIQPPGASEHQTGLALDVSINGQLTQDFANTEAGLWLDKNCHKFGFIIRYPKNKTNITNIIYEPWHLRYVGLPHAEIMKKNALVLEEYHGFIKEAGMYVCWGSGGDYFLVSYLDSLPHCLRDDVVDVSFCIGGGFIVTSFSSFSSGE